MSLADLPDGRGTPLASADAAGSKPHALRPPRVPGGWRIGSFSALISGAMHELAARDHDARVLPAAAVADSDAPEAGDGDGAEVGVDDESGAILPFVPAADDILRFPRGPVAGDCLHAVFEQIDFTDTAGWEAAIAAALAAHPQRLPAGADAERDRVRLPRMLRQMLTDVLSAPLLPADHATGPLTLDSVTSARRLVELGFHLPAPRVSAAEWNAWLVERGYRVPRLAFGELGGYLKGFVDLVFEHGGRYWVLDWKSNHLGDRPEDYAPAHLEAAMQTHGYHLQHLIYSLALHRHLGRSLPGYAYEAHFGGVLYLFVRGVRPHWIVGGQPAGVFHHRAPVSTITALDALLEGVAQDATGVAA
jgi:exodeoxyribonuclease V beta subunit